jgi:hypothetical protein
VRMVTQHDKDWGLLREGIASHDDVGAHRFPCLST